MGGSICVESEENKGSKFSFILNFKSLEGNKVSSNNLSFSKIEVAIIANQSLPSIRLLIRQLESFGINDIQLLGYKELLRLDENNFKDTVFIVDIDEENKNSAEAMSFVENLYLSYCRKCIVIGDPNLIKENNKVLYTSTVLEKPLNQSLLFDAFLDISNIKVNDHNDAVTNNAESLPVAGELRDTNILLVEDNQVNQLLATEILEEYGCVVMHAQNGEQALNLLNQSEFDLVLMDIQMPIMDGLTATKKIRSIEKVENKKSAIIIGLTANAFESDIEACFDAGMNDYLKKPYEENQLKQTIFKALQGKKT